MTVYILLEHFGYDGATEIIGVYSTFAEASQAGQNLRTLYHIEQHNVQ